MRISRRVRKSHPILCLVRLSLRLLFLLGVASPFRCLNAPDNLIGNTVASCHLPQRLALENSLDDEGPFGRWNLDRWSRRIDMRMLGWQTLDGREQQFGEEDSFQWRETSPTPIDSANCLLQPICQAAPALIANSACPGYFTRLFAQSTDR